LGDLIEATYVGVVKTKPNKSKVASDPIADAQENPICPFEISTES
jgi:hypothetical protein